MSFGGSIKRNNRGNSNTKPWKLHDFLQGADPQNNIPNSNNNTGCSFQGNYKSKKSVGDRPECQICPKLGHTTDKCFQLREILLGHSNAVSGTALIANLADKLGSDHNWLLDSGATHHLTGKYAYEQ